MTKPPFLPTIPPPGGDDSTDLTDLEVLEAVETQSQQHFAQLLAHELSPGQASVGKGDARYALSKHEIRRRKPHLYVRSHLVCPGEPPKILVYRVDWLQQ